MIFQKLWFATKVLLIVICYILSVLSVLLTILAMLVVLMCIGNAWPCGLATAAIITGLIIVFIEAYKDYDKYAE